MILVIASNQIAGARPILRKEQNFATIFNGSVQ